MRVRAHNSHGWGEWSPTLLLKASGLPETPLPPTTSVNNENIKIEWVDPENNEEAIDKYRILIAQEDRVTFIEILDYCDGANDVIISLKACEIPISILKSAPFSLEAGEEVIAQVRAHNANGWGENSV